MGVKKGLLGSAARASMTAPLATREATLSIGVTITDAATARIELGSRSFVLPDEQEALTAALRAMPDKDRAVMLDIGGAQSPPYRVLAGILHLAQAAGFPKVTVRAEPPAS